MARTHVTDRLVGDVLDGRYEILARLARGGMATVYRAWDRRLERIVAIKVMHEGLGDDADFAAKFDREARAAARLCDRSVVSIFDQGYDHGRPYIVMEFVEGATLRSVITAEAPLGPLRALQLIEPVAAALAAAHDSGLVHRDVKPENVLISDRGVVKVADFGLARTITAQTATTTQGLLIGTVSYLPPELLTSGRAQSWSDVYSTGIVLFEMLTGSKPYTGDTPIQVAYKHVNEDVPLASETLERNDPRQARREPIPDFVDALVTACTRRDPGVRPVDGRELLRRVRRARRALERGITHDEALTASMYPAKAFGSAPTTTLPTVVDTAAAAALGNELSPVTPLSEPIIATAHREVDAGRPRVRGRDYAAADRPEPPRPVAAPQRVRPTAVLPAVVDHEAARPHDQERFGELTKRANYRRRRGFALAVLVFLLTLAVGFGSWWFASGRYVATPSLINLGQAEATEVAAANGFTVTFTEEYSETVPVGLVISTDPAAGERVIRDTEIQAVLSAGPERYPMPEVVGLPMETARAALTANNLTVGTVTEVWDETQPVGAVVSAGYGAGEQLPRDTAVDLTVSLGPEPITVPNVVNMTLAQATEAITQAGLTVGRTTQAFSPDVERGRVLTQSPASGTAHRGDAVDLVISKGTEKVKVPDVVGEKVDDAAEELAEVGLDYEVVMNINLPGRQDRNVVRIEPGAGTEVPAGSTVRLYVI